MTQLTKTITTIGTVSTFVNGKLTTNQRGVMEKEFRILPNKLLKKTLHAFMANSVIALFTYVGLCFTLRGSTHYGIIGFSVVFCLLNCARFFTQQTGGHWVITDGVKCLFSVPTLVTGALVLMFEEYIEFDGLEKFSVILASIVPIVFNLLLTYVKAEIFTETELIANEYSSVNINYGDSMLNNVIHKETKK